MSATRVDLAWDVVPGADSYAVDRSVAFNVWTTIGPALTNVFSDTDIDAETAYLYRVRAIDGGVPSANSAVALASTFTFADDPVVPGLTPPRPEHVTEIRDVIGAVRSLAGLAPASYGSVAEGEPVEAVDFLSLRNALDPARATLALPQLTYAHALTAGVTPIRAVEPMELRAGATGRPPQFWSSVAALSDVQSLAGSGATILAGTTAQGVYRSLDHGDNWSPANSGLSVLNVASLAITTDGTFFAGTTGGGVFRSTNAGNSWALSGASPPQNVTTLLPAADGIFAASSIPLCSGIFFSGDGGSTWNPRNSGLLNLCVTSMAVAADGDLFAGTSGDGVFRSTDDGASWSAVNSGLSSANVHAVAVDASSRIYAATHTGGLFTSDNDGTSWSSSSLGVADVFSLFRDPTDELFAGGEGTGASLFRSSGGSAWQNAHDRLPRAAKIGPFGSTSRYRFLAVDGNVFRAPNEFRLHGLDFSPYLTEGSGSAISEATLKERMHVLQPHTKWIRTFGMTNGLQHSGRIAHSLGLKAALGAWISTSTSANDTEIANLIAAAQAGEADLLIVGSEVMRRREECANTCEVSEAQLVAYINQVKAAVDGMGILVGTAEIYDVLLNHPNLITASTVVLPNYYPWWHGIAVEHAIETLDDWHQQVVAASGGKPVVVSETGWPSAGTQRVDAIPSESNAAFYFLNFVSWARANNTGYFYFEAFDEAWKSGEPHGVGPHWGLWTNTASLKPDMDDVLAGDTMNDNWSGTALVGGPGTPSIAFTNVPPYGNSTQLLRGQVQHVRPAGYRVAAYIYVGGWYNKPTWEAPLTTIFADGTFACDIVTHPNDVNATQIAAFVVPLGYDPQDLNGPQTLPQELYDTSVAEIVVSRAP